MYVTFLRFQHALPSLATEISSMHVSHMYDCMYVQQSAQFARPQYALQVTTCISATQSTFCQVATCMCGSHR